MVDTRDVLALVPMIYDAALDQRAWDVFLRALNTSLEASCSVLHLQTIGAAQSGHVLAGIGVDLEAQQRYEEYYASRNIWTIRGRDKLKEGAVLTGEMVCANSELERSEYYCDYLRDLDFYHSLASVPSADSDTTLLVTTFRSKHRGTFEPECIALQKHLIPHLKRAAQLHARLLSVEVERRGLQHALDRMPIGVILLDLHGRTLFANRSAREIVAMCDGLKLTKDGPEASTAADTTFLRRLVFDASLASAKAGSQGGGVARLSRPSGTQHLEVLVAPVGQSTHSMTYPDAAIALFVTDPEVRGSPGLSTLRTLYRLTPSEARCAQLLTQGYTVSDISAMCDITEQTTRWLVKQVLSKTNARTQAQAVITILRGLSHLR